MKPSRIATAVALCFSLSGFACASNAPITRVTLYSGTATVERQAQVAPGMKELEITGLPANFDAHTLRIQASPGVQVGQIVTRDVGQAGAVSPREAELEAKLQALEDSRDLLNVEIESSVLVKNYLSKLNGGENTSTPVDGKSLGAAVDTIKRGGREALAQIQRSQIQLREIDKKIKTVQRELEKVRSGARDQRSITIAVAAQQAGSVQLSYQVNRAGWKPAYRASLNSTTSTIELERMAVVAQKSGEDWSSVEMRLSTGQPRLSPQAPEPVPQRLTYYPPRPPQQHNYGAAPEAPIAAAPAPVMVTGSRIAQDTFIPPVLETQGTFDTEFAVPNRVTLASDGREITLALSTLKVAAKQRVRVVPRQEKFAVITAEAERPSGVWLNGNIQLFRDGGYVGATHWNTQASDKLALSFGRDDLVRVTVDRADQQSGSRGFLSQRGEQQVADVFTISSFHKTPVDLLVLESTPVSASEEIKVKQVFSPQPGIAAWEQRQGVVGWEKTMAPNETMKINVGYSITYPKEGTVGGMQNF
ncbi:DUF4139 domain-containing protein [Pseudoduganella sp. R-34]|uniref:DUF4139 domain-containing protein n=1 Tax=Pseudoduganella sp. R-34 TaxID=3404062 RepID=UPI003CF74209